MLNLIIFFLKHALGWPLFVSGLVGLVYCLWRFPGKTLVLTLPGVSYCILFLGATMYVYPRFVLPIALLWCVLAGKMMEYLISVARWRVRVSAIAVLSLALVYSAVRALGADMVLIHDSRILAGRWIEANVAKGSTIAAYVSPTTLPYLSQDYQVHRDLAPLEEFVRCGGQGADYVIFSDRLYRQSTKRNEEADFQEALQDDVLDSLLAGEMGYDLVADIRYRLPGWLDLHIPLTFNPRIFILERNVSCDAAM